VSLSHAIESGDEDGGPTLGTNAPPYFSSGGDSMNQSHYGSNISAFESASTETSSPLQQSTYSDLSAASTLIDTTAGIGPQYESSMPFTTSMPTFANVGKSQLQADMGQHFHSTKDFAQRTDIQANYGWSQNLDSSDQPSPRDPWGVPYDATHGDKRTSWELEGLGKKGYRIKGSKGKDEPLDKSTLPLSSSS
jgi:hypothetical protein